MNKKVTLAALAGLLAFGSTSAWADHDRHLRYVVGGAVVGAALGGLVSASRQPHVYSHYHAPRPRSRVVYHAPAPRVVYHTPAPRHVTVVPPAHRVTFVPPGHARKARGKKKLPKRTRERVVHVYYAR